MINYFFTLFLKKNHSTQTVPYIKANVILFYFFGKKIDAEDLLNIVRNILVCKCSGSANRQWCVKKSGIYSSILQSLLIKGYDVLLDHSPSREPRTDTLYGLFHDLDP